MTNDEGGGGRLVPLLAGCVLGPALQLQQAALWAWHMYAGMALAGALIALTSASRLGQPRRRAAWFAAALLLAFALTGARALVFQSGALAAALEGEDIAVTGIVAAMPQRNEGGVRFRFEVESAHKGAQPARVPALILLGWYGGGASDPADAADAARSPAGLRAGERWRMTVRLKAPHGNLNPHGFDYELWLWEQGVQASGYVRASPRDPPRRMAATWRHPVEQARQSVRDAIEARVSDPKAAGLIAALVVGDQNAIDLGSFANCLLRALEGNRRTAVVDFLQLATPSVVLHSGI